MKRNLTGQGFHPSKLEDPVKSCFQQGHFMAFNRAGPDEMRRARLNRPQLNNKRFNGAGDSLTGHGFHPSVLEDPVKPCQAGNPSDLFHKAGSTRGRWGRKFTGQEFKGRRKEDVINLPEKGGIACGLDSGCVRLNRRAKI